MCNYCHNLPTNYCRKHLKGTEIVAEDAEDVEICGRVVCMCAERNGVLQKILQTCAGTVVVLCTNCVLRTCDAPGLFFCVFVVFCFQGVA